MHSLTLILSNLRPKTVVLLLLLFVVIFCCCCLLLCVVASVRCFVILSSLVKLSHEICYYYCTSMSREIHSIFLTPGFHLQPVQTVLRGLAPQRRTLHPVPGRLPWQLGDLHEQGWSQPHWWIHKRVSGTNIQRGKPLNVDTLIRTSCLQVEPPNADTFGT